ncbi:MAG: DUF4325 domain-containing protein [Planctomycetes bacterium]|nr:DUF4325 domain-containing protein [Planctomycetota bacterium]
MLKHEQEKIVKELLDENESFRTSEFAERAGITRQAAHRRLRALVATGKLERVGKGRGARYRRVGAADRFSATFPVSGLAEDRVWTESLERVGFLSRLAPNARKVFTYAFTELLNNAIEHSGSESVTVRFESCPSEIAFEIDDLGVGIFERVREAFALPNRLEALQELSKGRVTTRPREHTGEGIFFTSKVADRFEIDSGGLCWLVDNLRGEMTVRESPDRQGTRVRFAASPDKPDSLQDLFSAYTEELEFSRTRIAVRLFEIGTEFVSRSEAKRLVTRLEAFRDVVLDFTGVEMVGQGFVDEVFRVWAGRHPQIRITPANMNPAVEFMVRRGLGR